MQIPDLPDRIATAIVNGTTLAAMIDPRELHRIHEIMDELIEAIVVELEIEPVEPPQPSKAKRYGWARYAEENYYGPFDSIEKAKGDARINIPGNPVICVAVYPDPGEMADMTTDVEWILEAMGDHAHDSGFWSGDGELFEIRGDSQEAENALAQALREWASKYVTAEFFTAHPLTASEKLEELE